MQLGHNRVLEAEVSNEGLGVHTAVKACTVTLVALNSRPCYSQPRIG